MQIISSSAIIMKYLRKKYAFFTHIFDNCVSHTPNRLHLNAVYFKQNYFLCKLYKCINFFQCNETKGKKIKFRWFVSIWFFLAWNYNRFQVFTVCIIVEKIAISTNWELYFQSEITTAENKTPQSFHITSLLTKPRCALH